jgi:hemerythrin-like domain-containing protein
MSPPPVSTMPVGEFETCHLGIIDHLNALAEVPQLVDPAMRVKHIAGDALKFFSKVIYEHHGDEEKELFPAVLRAAQAGDEFDKVKAMVTTLTEQHRELELLWESLQPGLKKLAQGKDLAKDVGDIGGLVSRYSAHAQLEETAFLPLAKAILGRNDAHMGALGLSLHIRHTKLPTMMYV